MAKAKLTEQEWETFLGLADRLEIPVRELLQVSAHQHHSGPPGGNAGRRPVGLLAPVEEPSLGGPKLLPIRLVLPFLRSVGPDRVGM
jgi:hypothetical protein